MRKEVRESGTKEIFETKPVPSALASMALPTIMSQLITLIYNIADTWFIGQTDNPYMVAASSLVLPVFMLSMVLAAMYGTGGGSLMVRLMGQKEEEKAKKVASLTLVLAIASALVFSLLCLLFMEPILLLLGASEHTLGYAKQYLFFVTVIGATPTILSNTMSTMIRNIGHSKVAGFGLGMGGVLNVLLDPLFMFVILPDGYEVMGAALATMLSNVVTCLYFTYFYKKQGENSVLTLPRRIEKVSRESLKSLFAVGIPAGASLLLFDLTNMTINRLASQHGDISLAAMGIVQKVERFPINIGIGICLGMIPLIAYNYGAKNYKRLQEFFNAARIAGVAVAAVSVVLYRFGAPYIIAAFIDDVETVRLGTQFLQARCFATPFMFLSFNMVYFMQGVGRGTYALWLAAIRQLVLNIPILILLDHFFGMTGIVWTQAVADFLTVVVSYIIYYRTKRNILKE